jgi:hypothetical protein
MAKNKPEANSWVYRDVETMAQVANVAPIFIDADYGNCLFHCNIPLVKGRDFFLQPLLFKGFVLNYQLW